MYFSQEALNDIQEEYATIEDKYASLLIQFTKHPFANQRAAEYAVHGFARRLKVLVRCIDRVFELLPPDLDEIPSNEQVADAVIYIQSFIFNVFGCVDNMAWIWVYEKGTTMPDGKPLPDTWVGLRKTNKIIRQSFSNEFRTHLQGIDRWFDHLENFRHALAHRIPLYIPPYIIDTKNVPQHHRFDELIREANARFDFDEAERLEAQQKRLGIFQPIMTHSFEEKANQVVFHPQLIANFNTIDELGYEFLDELNR